MSKSCGDLHKGPCPKSVEMTEKSSFSSWRRERKEREKRETLVV
jgi:hypothetical protein